MFAENPRRKLFDKLYWYEGEIYEAKQKFQLIKEDENGHATPKIKELHRQKINRLKKFPTRRIKIRSRRKEEKRKSHEMSIGIFSWSNISK